MEIVVIMSHMWPRRIECYIPRIYVRLLQAHLIIQYFAVAIEFNVLRTINAFYLCTTKAILGSEPGFVSLMIFFPNDPSLLLNC